jgi:hypothetical protein
LGFEGKCLFRKIRNLQRNEIVLRSIIRVRSSSACSSHKCGFRPAVERSP